MIRIFNHYISKMILLLLCVETFLLTASIYLGVSIRFSDSQFIVPGQLDLYSRGGPSACSYCRPAAAAAPDPIQELRKRFGLA